MNSLLPDEMECGRCGIILSYEDKAYLERRTPAEHSKWRPTRFFDWRIVCGFCAGESGASNQ